jgi:hypothetical protein
MTFKIKACNDNSGKYGVTHFDTESGESLSDLFGTKIFASLELAIAYAKAEAAKITVVGEEALIEFIDY